MIHLHKHQEKMVNQTRAALRKFNRVCMQGPTGVGKTVIAAYIMRSAAQKNNRAYFVCHRAELVEQTSNTFTKFGIDHGVIAAGYRPNPFALIQVCSIDTLVNRLGILPAPILIVWDECHHIVASTWLKVFNAYAQSKHVGLTATTQRLDGTGLDNCFDVLVKGPSVAYLIDNGFLADYRLLSKPLELPDAYDDTELDAYLGNNAIMGDLVEHWLEEANGFKTLGFARNRNLSKAYAQEFTRRGIPSIHLDGYTPAAVRKRELQKLANDEYKVIWNVGLFGEGFDIAANSGRDDCVISCVIDAAPTNSLTAWLQRCGRALRKQPQKAVILDHAGNELIHGMPCDERDWSLSGSKSEERGERYRKCPECYADFLFSNSCPICGYSYSQSGNSEGAKVEVIEGKLTERQRHNEIIINLAEKERRTDKVLREKLLLVKNLSMQGLIKTPLQQISRMNITELDKLINSVRI